MTSHQVSYHGQTVAHIDTWRHFFENGLMYNGVSVKENLNPEQGCIKGSVMNWRGGVTTRAVLYDIAQLTGCDQAQFKRARIARPITQSLSLSDRKLSSSVKWVTRCR